MPTGQDVAPLHVGSAVGAIVPTSITEVQMVARMVASAGWAPKSYRLGGNENGAIDEAKVALGIMHGMEVGLKPLQALQNIAVINGQPSIWGDAALALCRASGVMADFAEEPIVGSYMAEGENRQPVKIENAVIGYRCTVKRKDTPTPTVQVFTMDDARRASLLAKSGPWQQYRQRMFQMRARGFALRDACPEVLKGLMLAEEAMDLGTAVAVPETKAATVRTGDVASRLDAFAPTTTTDQEPEVIEAEFTEGGEAEGVEAVGGAALPVAPEGIEAAFDAGSFVQWAGWFDAAAKDMDAAVRQQFADANMDRLRRVAKHSGRNAMAIATMASRHGLTLDLEGDD
jgi:hypothetical protein